MRWMVLVGLLLSAPAFAQDGVFVETRRGGNVYMDVFKLCDEDPGASDKQCAAFDLTTAKTGVSGSRPALPNQIAFSFHAATDCSGATTVTPQGSDVVGLDPRYALTDTPLDKPATSLGDQFSTPIAPPNRFVTALISTVADCTDVEVYLKLIYFQ